MWLSELGREWGRQKKKKKGGKKTKICVWSIAGVDVFSGLSFMGLEEFSAIRQCHGIMIMIFGELKPKICVKSIVGVDFLEWTSFHVPWRIFCCKTLSCHDYGLWWFVPLHCCRDIEEAFRHAARLQQEPALVDFAELLALISAAYTLREEGVLSDALSIYARIGRHVSAMYEPSEFSWWQKVWWLCDFPVWGWG